MVFCPVAIVFAYYGFNVGVFLAGLPVAIPEIIIESESVESRECLSNFTQASCHHAIAVIVGYTGLFFTLVRGIIVIIIG